MADGKILPEELGAAGIGGERAGMGDWDVRMLVKRVRAEAYAAAQEALRRPRRNEIGQRSDVAIFTGCGASDISATNARGQGDFQCITNLSSRICMPR